MTTYETWDTPDDLPLLQDGISQQTQYRAPFSDELAGKALAVVHDDGSTTEYRFVDGHHVERRGGALPASDRTYDATLVRPDIYLVDMLVRDVDLPGAVPGIPHEESWALDLAAGRITIVRSWVHVDERGRRWTTSAHEHATLVDRPDAGRHERSSGMVGHRVLWRYSDTDYYDHVYLNPSNFAWQCVAGVEKGLTELDRTTAYEIAYGLFLFGWSEHVQPVESSLFVDLREMKTFGRFFGWEDRTGEHLHHQFGATGQLLNVTTYPEA